MTDKELMRAIESIYRDPIKVFSITFDEKCVNYSWEYTRPKYTNMHVSHILISDMWKCSLMFGKVEIGRI